MSGPLPDAETTALLHLRLLPGLSDRRLAALLRQHGSARAVLRASAEELGEAAAGARGSRPVLDRLERARGVIAQQGIACLRLDAEDYPPALLQLSDPPPLLLARGRLELLSRPMVAVVGSRRHTTYGADATTALARDLSRAGIVVVSGLARGIDGIAHAAALEGGTVAVLGSGIDVAYPRQHAALFERIAADGLLLSEFPPGTPPLPHNFPQRNRIIAALALGVLVVEAAADSGSLITVDHALDLGRDVFAVPGPIGRDTSEGTNRLLRDGARLVTCAADVLAELGLAPAAVEARAAVGAVAAVDEPPLLRILSHEPLHLDQIADAMGIAPAEAMAKLLELELDGRIRQLAGARYVRA